MGSRIGGAALSVIAAGLLAFAMWTSWWSGHPHDERGEERQRTQGDITVLSVQRCDVKGIGCKRMWHFQRDYIGFAAAGAATLGASTLAIATLLVAAGLGLAGQTGSRRALAITSTLLGGVAIVSS